MRKLFGLIFALFLLTSIQAEETLRKDMPEPYDDGEGNYFCIKSGDEPEPYVTCFSDAELIRPKITESNLGRRCIGDIKSISGINDKCFKLTYKDGSFEYADIGSCFISKGDYENHLAQRLEYFTKKVSVLEIGQDWVLVYSTWEIKFFEEGRWQIFKMN